MNDENLLTVYEWIDTIPLSREKKNINRDFCDGVLTAELLKHYYPKIVDVHNYPTAYNTKQKMVNWNTLSIKVFKKIGFNVTTEEIEDIISSKPKAIEQVLWRLYNLIIKKIKINPIKSATTENNKKADRVEDKKVDKKIEYLKQENFELSQELQNSKAYNASLKRQIDEYQRREEYSNINNKINLPDNKNN